jgi:GTP-binding protein LepA
LTGRPRRRFPGFKEIKSQVFAGLYPVESNQYDSLRDVAGEAEAQRRLAALRAGSLAGARLRLPLRLPRPAAHGDRPGTSRARVRPGPDHHRADRGLRSPDARRQCRQVENPAKLPELSKTEEIREPIITTTVFVPQEYLGNVITLCNQKRGNQVDMTYHGRQVQLTYDMPMAEVVMDFFDKPEVRLARLRFARLRIQGIPGGRRRQARRADQRRQGRCPVRHSASRQFGRIAAANWRPRCAS